MRFWAAIVRTMSKGWISGLPEEEGREHLTAGGLRIGKLKGAHSGGAADSR